MAASWLVDASILANEERMGRVGYVTRDNVFVEQGNEKKIDQPKRSHNTDDIKIGEKKQRTRRLY